MTTPRVDAESATNNLPKPVRNAAPSTCRARKRNTDPASCKIQSREPAPSPRLSKKRASRRVPELADAVNPPNPNTVPAFWPPTQTPTLKFDVQPPTFRSQLGTLEIRPPTTQYTPAVPPKTSEQRPSANLRTSAPRPFQMRRGFFISKTLLMRQNFAENSRRAKKS